MLCLCSHSSHIVRIVHYLLSLPPLPTVHLTWSTLWVIEKIYIDDILMRSKIPSLVEMKRFCAWKFVSSSYNIGGNDVIFTLKNFQKIRHETDVNFEGAYYSHYSQPAIRRAKNKSNGCVSGSFTQQRTRRKPKTNEIRSAQSRDKLPQFGGGQLKSNVQYRRKQDGSLIWKLFCK
jgi:hypothetical protein